MENQQKTIAVKLSKKIFIEVSSTLAFKGVEEGGILGINNDNIIDFFVKDSPHKGYAYKYVPNYEYLNKVIDKWNKGEIKFCGMLHTHPLGYPKLSYGDVCYSKEILLNNPQMHQLYFGITQDDLDKFKIIMYLFIKDQDSNEITYGDISDLIQYLG